MQETGFEEVEAYVLMRQNTAAECIAMRTILGLCEEMVRMPGTWVAKRWWGQEGLYLVGARAATAAPEEEGRSEEIEGESEGVAGK